MKKILTSSLVTLVIMVLCTTYAIVTEGYNVIVYGLLFVTLIHIVEDLLSKEQIFKRGFKNKKSFVMGCVSIILITILCTLYILDLTGEDKKYIISEVNRYASRVQNEELTSDNELLINGFEKLNGKDFITSDNYKNLMLGFCSYACAEDMTLVISELITYRDEHNDSTDGFIYSGEFFTDNIPEYNGSDEVLKFYSELDFRSAVETYFETQETSYLEDFLTSITDTIEHLAILKIIHYALQLAGVFILDGALRTVIRIIATKLSKQPLIGKE